MDSVTAYFSHSIRGSKGPAATDEDVKRNCANAMKVVEWLRASVPGLTLYVPAEHEDFVGICWREKYLTEKEILEVDCKILDQQDFHIVHEVDGWLGGGIGVEIAHAKKINLLIFYVQHLDETEAAALRVIVRDIAKGKK